MREGSRAPGGGAGGNVRPPTLSEVEDFSYRDSSASSAVAGHSMTSIASGDSSSSPFSLSPWHNTQPPASSAPDLFPSGTGLVSSLVREEGHIYSLAASGDLLYTGSDSKNIRVWKNHREFSVFKSASGLVKAIVVSPSPSDRRVFTGHQDGKIRVWRPSPKNPKIHKRISTLPRLKDFIKSSFNPSNYRSAARNKSSVWIRHSDAVSALCLSEDQTLLYSGSWDRTIKVWRINDSRCLESTNAHDDAVNAIVIGPEGLVFSGSADGTVKVWRRDFTAGRHVAEQTLLKQECAVTALAVNVGSGTVYGGSSDGVVNLWERGLIHGGVLRGHKLAVLCLAAAGSLLFSGSADKTICIWRREAGGEHVCLSVLTGHGGPVKCLAVEKDHANEDEGAEGRWVLYSGSLDKSVKVWKVSDQLGADQQQPKFDMY